MHSSALIFVTVKNCCKTNQSSGSIRDSSIMPSQASSKASVLHTGKPRFIPPKKHSFHLGKLYILKAYHFAFLHNIVTNERDVAEKSITNSLK